MRKTRAKYLESSDELEDKEVVEVSQFPKCPERSFIKHIKTNEIKKGNCNNNKRYKLLELR